MLTCPECEKEKIAEGDYVCRTCRIFIDYEVQKGEKVIYHGMLYRGHILGCHIAEFKIEPWDEKLDPFTAEVRLIIPEEFSARTSIWTKEERFRCEQCNLLAINHWAVAKETPEWPKDYRNLCAVCLNVPLFWYGKRVGLTQ